MPPQGLTPLGQGGPSGPSVPGCGLGGPELCAETGRSVQSPAWSARARPSCREPTVRLCLPSLGLVHATNLRRCHCIAWGVSLSNAVTPSRPRCRQTSPLNAPTASRGGGVPPPTGETPQRLHEELQTSPEPVPRRETPGSFQKPPRFPTSHLPVPCSRPGVSAQLPCQEPGNPSPPGLLGVSVLGTGLSCLLGLSIGMGWPWTGF